MINGVTEHIVPERPAVFRVSTFWQKIRGKVLSGRVCPAGGSFFSSSFWPLHAVKHKLICLSRWKNFKSRFDKSGVELSGDRWSFILWKVETREVGAVRLETPTSSHSSQSAVIFR